MALYPFILIKRRADSHDRVLLNHEKIHHRQQLELLILPFYVWYLLEYLVNRYKYKEHFTAYMHISFEKEAYCHETDQSYLQKRRLWSFLRFY